MKRIAVVGAGRMARVRAAALLATEEVEICGVASQRLSSAEAFGAEIGCRSCHDDYRELAETAPDAVLIEVPHGVQDEVALWALESGAHVLFEDDVLYSQTAGYVRPAGLPAWSVTFIGTDGAVELAPPDALKVYRGAAEVQSRDLVDARDPFEVQAGAFVAALDGRNECRNPPSDALWDVRVAEAVVASARQKRTVQV